MLYAVLFFLAAFPHTLHQRNIFLPHTLCSLDVHSALLVSRVSVCWQKIRVNASIHAGLKFFT